MVSNIQPTIIELQECCSMLTHDIEIARATGDSSSAELQTCEAALAALEERIKELLASASQLGS